MGEGGFKFWMSLLETLGGADWATTVLEPECIFSDHITSLWSGYFKVKLPSVIAWQNFRNLVFRYAKPMKIRMPMMRANSMGMRLQLKVRWNQKLKNSKFQMKKRNPHPQNQLNFLKLKPKTFTKGHCLVVFKAQELRFPRLQYCNESIPRRQQNHTN